MAKSNNSGGKPNYGAPGAARNETSHDVQFAKGGTTKMFGVQDSEEQEPGGTAHKTSKGDKGASTSGYGDESVQGDKFASGGKTKMFGFSGALPARDGITSAR
jgi:hypothetical protein